MSRDQFSFPKSSRRDLLRAAMYGVGVSAAAIPSPLFAQAAASLASEGKSDGKILVVLELSGGNDGLNTLVPYGDDAYYKHRPKLGIPAKQLRRIDEHFGFSGGMAGFERLYKNGKLAIVHGCGYENPSFSHFTSMAYWQTAAPNSGEEYGWVGRVADAMAPDAAPNFLVNIAARQSLAVRARHHVPVVFDDPNRFSQEKFYDEREVLDAVPDNGKVDNPARQFLLDTAKSAKDASALVREAWAKYKSPVDYGITGLDLPKVAALIQAKMPTRLYYTSYRNNAFDTHVFQEDVHKRLLTYASDAVSAFMLDLERIGRADDVVVMIFSEFGRRVPENVNLGTDHGTANLMFVAGKQVKGGHYGKVPSLTALDAGDNLIYTTDFRRVYATMISGWLGLRDTKPLLNGTFEPFDLFQRTA
ncbi:MAG TPA: DUF1501 domain-containing protein [Bryobacteraceae bacterium]|jgi:uncharacterized protein (DUF1501 family)|nr:DUF1501 domain-containing protein [Bryobacteraceae bacterium]